ncbi:MAG: molybdopterin-dependent oxidoreductase [Betaproteobacteria bacterium]|nr:molybdopterin-dependent oxidoreductase [Betaproteobacteria bacterium]
MSKTESALRTEYRACNLCEAICGLEFKIDGAKIVSIRGDDADPFSRGHICPKAVALKDIHEDPDRLRKPMKRTQSATGNTWQEIGWDEAYEFAADRIASLIQQHGNNAVGFYAGNPSVHNIGHLLGIQQLARLLKTRSAFSASSVDQLPQQLTSLLMYGHQFLIPIPDIDRTDYFLILGGNPIASNGSMMTVPDVARRLKAIQTRGGKIVVIDPRRTETAEIASEHHFIRPGSDAALLMAMLNVIRAEGLMKPNPFLRLKNLDAALDAIANVTPAAAADMTGIAASEIERIAREFAKSRTAIAYGRLGACLQPFGTVAQWLVQLLNIVTGNLDREGGALPTNPVIPITGPGTRPGHYAQWASRVSGLPESGGELPVATLAEEIFTPGEGQIRGMITMCGNPVLSTPNGRQLDRALELLDFMMSIDIYLNETTRHADLILPPTSALNHDHYDLIFNAFAVRNVTRYNEAIWARPEDERYDWEIFSGVGERLAAKLGREFAATPELRRIIGGMLKKSGNREGTTLESLKAAPHGIDLGALRPSLSARIETPDQQVDCAPPPMLADIARFNRELVAAASTGLRLIGRRHVRSNNSWMHNYHRLVKGKARHQLLMHPNDLASRGIASGQVVELSSRIGILQVPVEASTDMMPGVVCLPHGWGHDREGTRLGIASTLAGASYNDVSDDKYLDAISGNAALNGIAVEVGAVT